jgi:hypothetical protein
VTDIDALASRVKEEFGTFDLLSVGAGFAIRAPFESMTEAVYDEMLVPTIARTSKNLFVRQSSKSIFVRCLSECKSPAKHFRTPPVSVSDGK